MANATPTAPSELREKVDDLNEMILEGKALEAFDKYYAENVVMQEGAEEPFVGKQTNREREEEFFGSVTELRAMELKNVAVGEGVTMCEWHFDYTHEEWGDVKYDQVAVQRWEDGKIAKERFYKAG